MNPVEKLTGIRLMKMIAATSATMQIPATPCLGEIETMEEKKGSKEGRYARRISSARIDATERATATATISQFLIGLFRFMLAKKGGRGDVGEWMQM